MSTSQSGASSNQKKVVCVTGAGGFIASWLIKALLSKGYSVNGTVREPGSQKNQHLMKFESASENLKLFKADLLNVESVYSAIVGCNAVFHVASPVPTTDVRDPEKELVEPAVKGTLHVLQASLKAKVERVVFMSSITAVAFPVTLPKNKVLDESCWSDLDHCKKIKKWYGYSKTKAEMETLTFTRQFPSLDVVSVCPTTVLGPILQTNKNINASSLELISIYGSDSVENGHRWLVDVRDLADALILAYENGNAKGRYICHSHQIATPDLVIKLKSIYPNYKYPTKFTEFDNYKIFNTKKLRSLGWNFRSLEETLIDSIESYKKAGILES